jgi:hypothetical protein
MVATAALAVSLAMGRRLPALRYRALAWKYERSGWGGGREHLNQPPIGRTRAN